MKEIDELIALQPQNLAAELGSAVIDDELQALSEENQEINEEQAEDSVINDSDSENPEQLSDNEEYQ
jgi:hypothetical protein